MSGRTRKSYVEHSRECTSIHKSKAVHGALANQASESPIPPIPVAAVSRVPDRNECVTFPLSTLATDPVMSPVPPTGFILCKRWLEYLNECKV